MRFSSTNLALSALMRRNSATTPGRPRSQIPWAAAARPASRTSSTAPALAENLRAQVIGGVEEEAATGVQGGEHRVPLGRPAAVGEVGDLEGDPDPVLDVLEGDGDTKAVRVAQRVGEPELRLDDDHAVAARQRLEHIDAARAKEGDL